MADRAPDRLGVAPRFSSADAAALNARFAGVTASEMVAAMLAEGLIGRAALVSSFGAESAVLLHLVAEVDRTLPVLFLDTGKHFGETLAYRDRLVARLGLEKLINLAPDPGDLVARDAKGERWSYDPDGCCDLRKVRPLARALAAFDASFSGRKSFQGATREWLARVEIDATDAAGRLKINPLADWSRGDLDDYLRAHDLPVHPLAAQGYPSIGCAPCTSRVDPGEHARAGRWRGFEKTECGIHVAGGLR